VTVAVRGRAGRYTPDKLEAVLRRVSALAGLDPTGAELVKFTANAVFRLPGDGAVVRIAGSQALRHRVGKVVRVARWLAEADFPAVRLWPGLDQPVRIGEYLATVWQEVPVVGPEPTVTDLARLLHRLHRLPVPATGLSLPHWTPLDDVGRRLGDAEQLSSSDRRFLRERRSALDERLARLSFPSTPVVVHGDAHLGNLIAGPDGPVLCDFDSTCLGPAEWDLTPVAVGVLRFDDPIETQREFAAAYGHDVTDWSGFEVLREVRELKLVTSVLPILRSHPDVRDELTHRLSSLRDGDRKNRWHRYR
jgi:aminoglycoside phosphotransferase